MAYHAARPSPGLRFPFAKASAPARAPALAAPTTPSPPPTPEQPLAQPVRCTHNHPRSPREARPQRRTTPCQPSFHQHPGPPDSGSRDPASPGLAPQGPPRRGPAFPGPAPRGPALQHPPAEVEPRSATAAPWRSHFADPEAAHPGTRYKNPDRSHHPTESTDKASPPGSPAQDAAGSTRAPPRTSQRSSPDPHQDRAHTADRTRYQTP